jgi:hypothetical protein
MKYAESELESQVHRRTVQGRRRVVMAGWSWWFERSSRTGRNVAILTVVAMVVGTLTVLAPAATAGPVPTSLRVMSRQDSSTTLASFVARARHQGGIDNAPSFVASSPGGNWNHLHLTRLDPFASFSSWIGTFKVQYSYGLHVLQWSTHLAPSVIVLFHDEEVAENYAVWVETQGIKFSDDHDQLPSYTFHSSLTSYKYGGRGVSFIPMPGQWFEIEFVALNNWGIVGMKESISIGR